MAKQILIDLVFNANTSQAKSQMNQLQRSLNQLQTIASQAISSTGLTTQLKESQAAVMSLKTNLQSAFNVDTGRLDLSKFNNNLKAGNMTLSKYRVALGELGPAGYQAFNQLTSAVIKGEMPLKRTQNILTSMLSTLGSSIKWTIAYGAIDNIRQGFANAFEYAKDLNESLTNIGVVAQKSTQEMSKFAETANKAAKALSATTVAYSDAALIYYQQGLSDDQVAERAATTMKLANVVGESASTVSEWMTAIWNNFDDGSKKLEYYGDVLAKLGAETASSADEIADGFEKFAAVAETVGLSYEKGAAAIATVTATTRQSADVVGTAFKTIFARMQDLELGNTLDDGTTLGQYSEALNKVGINIKTTSGDLKEMDDILAEMGGTWKTLSNDEQVALAKSVAGIRQYTQLIALMNNFDYFEQLTASAENASGTLEEQQERWAESWEASSNRVKVAAEGIYSNLINDEFFIGLNNIWADLLSGMDKFMDAIGGLQTILPFVLGMILSIFGPRMIASVKQFAVEVAGTEAREERKIAALRREEAVRQKILAAGEQDNRLGEVGIKIGQKQLQLLKNIEDINRNITKAQSQQLKYKKDSVFNLAEELEKEAAIYVELEKQNETLQKKNANKTRSFAHKELGVLNLNQLRGGVNDPTNYINMSTIPNILAEGQIADQTKNNFLKTDVGTGKGFNSMLAQDSINRFKNTANLEMFSQMGIDTSFLNNFDGTEKSFNNIKEQLKEIVSFSDKAEKEIKEVLSIRGENIGKSFSDGQLKKFLNSVKSLTPELKKSILELRNQGSAVDNLEIQFDQASDKAVKFANHLKKMPKGELFASVLGGIASVAGALSSITYGIKGVSEALTADEFSFESLLMGISSLAMGAAMLMGTFKALKGTMLAGSLGTSSYALAVGLSTKAVEKEAIAIGINNKEKTAEQLLDAKDLLMTKLRLSEEQALLVIKEMENGVTLKEALLTTFGLVPKKGDVIATNEQTKATWKLWLAKMALKAPMLFLLAALAALAIAIVAVVAITKALVNWYNKDAIAAEKAAEQAKNLSENYNKVKESYDNLKQSLSDYHEAESALNKLTKGSQEWKEALQEANASVLELIQTYPELARYVERTADGQLKISKAGEEAVLNAAAANTTAAFNASLNANQISNEAQLKSQKTNMVHDELDTYDDAGTWILGISGALTTILTAGMDGGLGMVVATDAIAHNEIAAQESEDALSKIVDDFYKLDYKNAYDENGNFSTTWLEANNIVADANSELAEKISKNTEEIQNLIDTNKQLVEQERANNLAKVNTYLNTQGITTSTVGAGFEDAMINMYENAQDSIDNYKGIKLNEEDVGESWSENWGLWSLMTDEGEKAAQEFLKIQGYTTQQIENAIKDSNFSETEFSFTDPEGNEQTFSYELMAQTLKDKAVGESSDTALAISQLENTIFKLESAGVREEDQAAQQALGNYIRRGDFGVTEQNEVDALLGLSEEAKKQLFEKSGVTEEVAKSLVSKEELEDAGGDAYKALIASIKKMASSEYYDPTLVAMNQQIELGQSINTTFTATAEKLEITKESLEGYTTALVKNNKALKTDLKTAADATVEIWTIAKGLNKLEELFDKLKVALDDNNKGTLEYYEALGQLEQQLEDTFGLSLSTNFVESNLPLIKKAADDDVDALIELRKEINKDFILSLDIEQIAANELTSLLDDLNQQALNKPIGTVLDLNADSALTTLNELLLTGKMTEEELTQIFANSGIAMPKLNTTTVPQTTTTESDGVLFSGSPFAIPYKSTNTTTTDLTVPYFGDVEPTIDKKTNKITYNGSSIATGASKGVDFKNLTNRDTLKQAQAYKGIDNLESASDKKSRLNDLDDEVDHYHEIERAIENTERELDSLSKAKDRAFGADKLALMEQEIDKYEEMLDEQQQLIDKAKERYEVEKQNLLNNYAVELNDEGEITNHNDLIQQQINKLKGMDSNNDAYEEAEQYLDQMQNDFAQYEEELSKLKDEQQSFIDLQNEMADLAMEKIEYKVQIEVDAAEDDMAYIDFLMSKIEDDAFAVAEKVALQGDTVDAVVQQIAATEDGIAQIMADVNEQGFMTDAQAEQLREYRDNLIDYESQLREIKTTVEESLTEAYDAWNEKLDENISKFDHYTSMMESYRNIIDLVGKDTLGLSNDVLRQISKMQVENSRNLLKSSREAMEANKSILESYKQAYQNATIEEDKKYWEEQIKLAEEQVRESTESFMSNWENALQAAADEFRSNIELIVETFEESVSGIYDSLEELNDAFEKQQEINERYLADYEKTYEISKLNRQIEQSLDKTDSVANQKALRGLQSELLALQEAGVDVSERDIQFMQKKYDLMLAEQALRDAQNAKSIVRLRRDSEGNYGYVYTADQTAINEAEQTYEDKLYEFQKWGEESLNTIQENIVAIQQEFSDAVRQISEDESLSIAEREQKIAEITAYYQEKLRYWVDEGNKLTQWGAQINAKYNTEMADSFKDTILGSMYEDQQTWEDLYTLSHSNMEKVNIQFINALNGTGGYKETIDKVFADAGTSVKDFKDDVAGSNGYLNQVQQASKDTADEATNLANEMKTAMESATGYVSDFQNSYSGFMSMIQSSTQTTIGTINNLIGTYQGMEAAALAAKKAQEDLSDSGTSTPTSASSGSSGTTPYVQTTVPPATTNKVKLKETYVGGKAYWLDEATGKYYDYNNATTTQQRKGGVQNIDISNWKETNKLQKLSEGTFSTNSKFEDNNNTAWNDTFGFTQTLPKAYIIKRYGSDGKINNSNNWQVNSLNKSFGGATIVGYKYITNGDCTHLFKLVNVKDDSGNLWGGTGNFYINWTDLSQLLAYNPNTLDIETYRSPYGYYDHSKNKWISYEGGSFDTGGYTGSWGPEGRMAMLHQKEIVLNAQDTENFLSAINIVRSIADQLESNALAAKLGLTAYSAASVKTQGDILQQEVTIHAEFPNATNHSEIEEAFRNLNNLASQYANRKN